MKIDQLVTDTFTAHEHLAPDAEPVLATVRGRIEHRSQAAGWATAISAAAVVTAVVAGSTWGALTLRDHHSSTGTSTGPATRTAQLPTKQPTKHAIPLTTKAIQPLKMPFELGWVPAGSANYYVDRINIGSVGHAGAPVLDGEYMLTVTTATTSLDIDVQQMPGDLTGVRFKSGPGAPITVNGRPGIESSNAAGPGGYELYFQGPAGGVLYVNVARHQGKTGPVDQLRATGRRVGQNVRLPGNTEVRPGFGIGYLPAGMSVTSFDVENLSGQFGLGDVRPSTSYTLGTLTSQQTVSAVSVGTNIASQPSGTPGRPVQGHQTRYQLDHGYNTLYVLGAGNTKPIAIAARLPLSELYKIGDGLLLRP